MSLSSPWVPFDALWVIQALEHPVSLDPQLVENPAMLTALKTKLRAAERVILKQNPDNSQNLIYYFRDPQAYGWAVAASVTVHGEDANFLFNFLPDGELGALQVWFHETPSLTH